MYVSIDLEEAAVLHKHPKMTTICSLVHIEAPASTVLITDCSPLSLRTLGLARLRKLHESVTGEHLPAHVANDLAKACWHVVNALLELPNTKVDEREVEQQAESVGSNPSQSMRYVFGASKPAPVTKGLFGMQLNKTEIKRLQNKLNNTTIPNNPFGLISTETGVLKMSDKIVPQDTEAPAQTAEKPAKAPKAQRPVMPEQNGITHPRPGTKAAQIFELADNISKGKGEPATMEEMLMQGEAAGLNIGNIRIEFGRWRKFHGLVAARATKTETPAAPAAPAAE